MSKGKLTAGLASVGAAAGMALFPASAGADTSTICTFVCGGGGGEETGLTTALTTVALTDCGGDPDCGGQVAVEMLFGRLAGNHNETVLTLA